MTRRCDISPGSNGAPPSLPRDGNRFSKVARHPSRYDNPFATCWTKPGAIPFRFTAGASLSQLLLRFAAANWYGAIIGPHGSGKSALLETLTTQLMASGHPIKTLTLKDGQRQLSPESFADIRKPREAPLPKAPCLPSQSTTHLASARGLRTSTLPRIIIVDGYEQLAWTERVKLVYHCRRESLGLLLTSHSVTCLPTLVKLAPDSELVNELVAGLCAQVSTFIDPNIVAASHACHGSNVREIFFDLYDRYERIRRKL